MELSEWKVGELSLLSRTYSYTFGPFQLNSEIPLPELREPPRPQLQPVSIRLGEVPRTIAGVPIPDSFCTVSEQEYLLDIPDVARFHVTGGDEVTIDARPGVPDRDLRLYLMGSVFGALCHQNGYLPLHSSAVQSGAGVTAFLGDSGAGKSTLAAGLWKRGYPVVSDDICLLDGTGASNTVVPLAGWLKLWRRSLHHLNETPDPADRVFSTDDKYRIHLKPQTLAATRLGRIVVIERSSQPRERPRLEPLTTSAAMTHLMTNVYLPFYPEAAGAQARFFHRCAAVLSHAEAFRLVAPWGWEHQEATLDLLEKRLLRPAAGRLT